MWAQHATCLETISREREIVCVCAKIKPTKVRTTTVGGQESAAKWKQKNELITLRWTQSLVENVRDLSHAHTHAHQPHTTARTTPARILPHMRVRHPNYNEMHTTEKGQRVCRIRTASLEGGAAGSWMGRAKILTSTTRAPRADETVRPGVTGAQH